MASRYESGPDAGIRATAEALGRAADARSIVLVEGVSDQIAVEVSAERLGRDLVADGVVVVPIGGAHAVRRLLAGIAPRSPRVSGLVDAAEAHLFHQAANGSDLLTPERIHVCERDLEGELLRAIDPPDLERLLAAEGDLPAFRTLQKQAGWRDRAFDQQMHRWLRSISGRRTTYAALILRDVPRHRLPPPLVAVAEGA